MAFSTFPFAKLEIHIIWSLPLLSHRLAFISANALIYGIDLDLQHATKSYVFYYGLDIGKTCYRSVDYNQIIKQLLKLLQ